MVIAQSIQHDTEVLSGTTIDLVISDGSDTSVIKVPEYTGLKIDSVKELIIRII